MGAVLCPRGPFWSWLGEGVPCWVFLENPFASMKPEVKNIPGGPPRGAIDQIIIFYYRDGACAIPPLSLLDTPPPPPLAPPPPWWRSWRVSQKAVIGGNNPAITTPLH